MRKSERHTHYKKVLQVLLLDEISGGVCLLLDHFTKGVFSWEQLAEEFPEWWAKKPTGSTWDRWWPFTKKGQQQRIIAIKKCIKETAPKTPQPCASSLSCYYSPSTLVPNMSI